MRSSCLLLHVCVSAGACTGVTYELDLTVDPASVATVSVNGEVVATPFRFEREFTDTNEAYTWPGLAVRLTPSDGDDVQSTTIRLACKPYVGDSLAAEVDALQLRVERVPETDVIVTGGGNCEGDETIPWALE